MISKREKLYSLTLTRTEGMKKFISNPVIRLVVTLVVVCSVGAMIKFRSVEVFNTGTIRLIETNPKKPWNVQSRQGCKVTDKDGSIHRGRGPINKWYDELKEDKKWIKPNQSTIVNLEYYTEFISPQECKERGIKDPGEGGVIIARLGEPGQKCELDIVKVSGRGTLYNEFIDRYYSYKYKRVHGQDSPRCDCIP